MISIKLELDTKFTKSMKKLLSEKQYDAASKRSMVRAITEGYTAGNRAISSEYTIKLGDVRSLSVARPAKGMISYGEGKRGRMLTTAHFRVTPAESQAAKPRPAKRRHKLTIKRRAITRWFIIPGKASKVLWKRTGPGRKDVLPVKAVSIAEMANVRVQKTVQDKMQ
jgi:hypothetical protein